MNVDLNDFILENIAFTRTIVFKCEDVAVSDNKTMEQQLGIIASKDKTSWRYYMNLNGNYHVTDDVMTVRSLDNDEDIIFNKENLELHLTTKKAYRLGSYYFTRLVERYPHQLDLIRGIINPIPPEESIPAKDLSILRYNQDYVLWNELQLMPSLQRYINDTGYQLFDTEYKYTDNLVLPSLLGIVERNILSFLLLNRFENRRTRYAHSFFIWSHLQSLGISSIYKRLLNNKQTMWLFRNAEYTLRKTGKTHLFDQLVDILLTERDIPIAKYDMLYKTENMLEDLSPDPNYLVTRINKIRNIGTRSSFKTIELTTQQEIPESLDNALFHPIYGPETEFESKFSEQNNFPIKILESEMEDITNRQHDTIFTILFNEWIYMANKGYYTINLSINESVTGRNIRINTIDALGVWFAIQELKRGNSLNITIPSFFYHKAMRAKAPSLKVLMGLGGQDILNKGWCLDLLATHIKHSRIISPAGFYEFCSGIRDTMWNHTKMYVRYLSIDMFSQRKNATEVMYESGLATLFKNTTYKGLLEKYEIDLSSYSTLELDNFAWEIWKKATGWGTIDYISLAQQQEGLIELFKHLSSYSLQFIYNTVAEEGVYETGIDLFTSNGMDAGVIVPTEPDKDTRNSEMVPIHHHAWSEHELEKTGILMVSPVTGLQAETELIGGLRNMEFMIEDVEKEGLDVNNAFILEGMIFREDETFKDPYDIEELIPKSVTKIVPEENVKNTDLLIGGITYNGWTVNNFSIRSNEDWYGTKRGKEGWYKSVPISGFFIDGNLAYYKIPLFPILNMKMYNPYKLVLEASHQKYGTRTFSFDYPTKPITKSSYYNYSFGDGKIPLAKKFIVVVTATGNVSTFKNNGVVVESIIVTSESTNVTSCKFVEGSISYQNNEMKFKLELQVDKLPAVSSTYQFNLSINYLYNEKEIDTRYQEVGNTSFNDMFEIGYDQFVNPEDTSGFKFNPIPRNDF